jgi:ABC-2 type transport system permease protein
MNLSKVWLIATHEFWTHLRRPSFLFAVFGTPLIIALSMGLGALSGSSSSDIADYRPVGVLDRTEQGLFARQVPPSDPDLADVFVWVDDEETARQQVLDRTLAGYLDFGPDYVASGDVTLYGLRSAPEDLLDAVDSLVIANLSASFEMPVPSERVEKRVELTVTVLENNRTFGGDSVFFFTILPIVFGFLLVMASMTTSSFLMNSLTTEKTNRIMELLVTSVRPMELLGGKVLGLGLLGLLQVVILLTAAIIGLTVAQQNDFLVGLSIPPDMAVLAVVYYVLSYFLLASGLAAIGVLTGSEKESNQLSAVVILPIMLPYMALFTFFIDPNGTLPTLFTLIPFTSPMAVMMRVGLTTVPAWQIAVSLAGLIVVDVLILWAAARLFRWGMLSYGKTPGLRAIWQIIRGRGDHVNTPAAPRVAKESE